MCNMNNTLKFMLCTICCTLVSNNGYSMNEVGENFTFGPQNKINDEFEKQESDQEFLDRIEKEICENEGEIIREFYCVSYAEDLLSSLSNDDQQRFKKLIEEKPDLVFEYELICKFLVEQKPSNESSHCIKDLLNKNSNDTKCLLYFLKHKLEELTIDDVTKPKSKGFLTKMNARIEHLMNIINQELTNM